MSWSASKQEDFSHYNIYRSESLDGGYDLIAKVTTNSYVDNVNEDGKSYFYRVSVVDKDDLESVSDQHSVQGKTLIRPKAPDMLSAKLLGKDIKIVWSKTDARALSFVVEQRHKEGWFDEKVEEFSGIKGTSYLAKNVAPDSTYTYRVYSVDKNGIRSEPSNEVKVVTPESTELQAPPPQKPLEEDAVDTTLKEEHKEDVIAPAEDLDVSGL